MQTIYVEKWEQMSSVTDILGFIFYKYLSEKAISFANELLKDEGLAEEYHQLDENNPDHAELIDGIKETQ